MSIILKGIDMPKKGTNIVLTIYGRDGTYDAKTYPSGPCIKAEAIQIPKGHGRLIDEREVILHHYETVYREVEHPKYQITPREMLDDAPTILEAEE